MTLLRDALIVLRGLGASASRPVPAVRLAYAAAGRVGVTGQATTTRSAARSTAGHAATHYAAAHTAAHSTAGHTASHSTAGHAAAHFAAVSHATAYAPNKYDGAVRTGIAAAGPLGAGVTGGISATTGTEITIGAAARSKRIGTSLCMRPFLWYPLR